MDLPRHIDVEEMEEVRDMGLLCHSDGGGGGGEEDGSLPSWSLNTSMIQTFLLFFKLVFGCEPDVVCG